MRLTVGEVEMENDLKEKMDEFIFLKETQGKSERTIDDYRKEFNKFYLSSSKRLDSGLLKGDVLRYFSSIPSTSSAVFNRPYSCLNAFFNWCVRQEYLPNNPLLKAEIMKKKDDSNITAADLRDVRKLLNACDRRTYTGLRNYAIISLMIDTGIRTSELVRLEDSDYQKDRIVIRSEVCKTKNSRIIYLSPSTSSTIGKLIKIKPAGWSKFIFSSREGNQLATNQLAREFRRLCEKCNVKITPYQLRHTFATVCVENGVNVFLLQQMMGHSDIAMTRRYTDINQKQIEEAYRTFSPMRQL